MRLGLELAEQLEERVLLADSIGFLGPLPSPKDAAVWVFRRRGDPRELESLRRQGAVGETAAQIRRIRPPDAYKGKGIRYSDELVRTKVGKAGVA